MKTVESHALSGPNRNPSHEEESRLPDNCELNATDAQAKGREDWRTSARPVDVEAHSIESN